VVTVNAVGSIWATIPLVGAASIYLSAVITGLLLPPIYMFLTIIIVHRTELINGKLDLKKTVLTLAIIVSVFALIKISTILLINPAFAAIDNIYSSASVIREVATSDIINYAFLIVSSFGSYMFMKKQEII
jgi:hypothetical protein